MKNKNIQELNILTNNLRQTLRPFLSKILSKFVVFLVILLCATTKVKAQTISMDQLPIEDALRRLQLMGKIESDISFMSRPLQPT
ncbi:MAG: hypothetical protein EBV82_09790, partial [Chitinophagia bacterium]|nr:hypothetical protein [Chitinophagia bacterium]